MQDALGVLAATGTLRDDLDRVVSFEDFAGLVDLDAHYAEEQRYT
jgi:hypothetical protein